MTQDYRGSLLSYPPAYVLPLSPNEMVINTNFFALSRKGPIPGVLLDGVYYGAFQLVWQVSYWIAAIFALVLSHTLYRSIPSFFTL